MGIDISRTTWLGVSSSRSSSRGAEGMTALLADQRSGRRVAALDTRLPHHTSLPLPKDFWSDDSEVVGYIQTSTKSKGLGLIAAACLHGLRTFLNPATYPKSKSWTSPVSQHERFVSHTPSDFPPDRHQPQRQRCERAAISAGQGRFVVPVNPSVVLVPNATLIACT